MKATAVILALAALAIFGCGTKKISREQAVADIQRLGGKVNESKELDGKVSGFKVDFSKSNLKREFAN